MQGSEDQRRLISVREAAAHLGLSPWTIYSWVTAENPKIRSIKLGSRRMIALADLEAFVESARESTLP